MLQSAKRTVHVHHRDQKIAGLYDLGETIGKGHFAVVKLARHVFTGERVAVKIIDKVKLDEVSRSHLYQEVRCMKLVQHPNVVRLYEVIDTNTKLYLILEWGDGGDLYDYIMNHDKGLSEEIARCYFAQILEAISYCHRLHVCHRDLKPENVVFFQKTGTLKLTDFGFSNMFVPGSMLDTSCGSLAYTAPEILIGDSYDATAVDIWSLGVILYMLVCGELPFNETNDNETLTLIMDCKYNIPGHVSQLCRSLIERMIVRDPSRRIKLDGVLTHPWISPQPDQVVPSIDPGHGHTQLNFSSLVRPPVRATDLSESQRQLILDKMVQREVATRDEIISSVEEDRYDHCAATFFLLAERMVPQPTLPVSAGSSQSTTVVHQQRRERLVLEHRSVKLPPSPISESLPSPVLVEDSQAICNMATTLAESNRALTQFDYEFGSQQSTHQGLSKKVPPPGGGGGAPTKLISQGIASGLASNNPLSMNNAVASTFPTFSAIEEESSDDQQDTTVLFAEPRSRRHSQSTSHLDDSLFSGVMDVSSLEDSNDFRVVPAGASPRTKHRRLELGHANVAPSEREHNAAIPVFHINQSLEFPANVSTSSAFKAYVSEADSSGVTCTDAKDECESNSLLSSSHSNCATTLSGYPLAVSGAQKVAPLPQCARGNVAAVSSVTFTSAAEESSQTVSHQLPHAAPILHFHMPPSCDDDLVEVETVTTLLRDTQSNNDLLSETDEGLLSPGGSKKSARSPRASFDHSFPEGGAVRCSSGDLPATCSRRNSDVACSTPLKMRPSTSVNEQALATSLSTAARYSRGSRTANHYFFCSSSDASDTDEYLHERAKRPTRLKQVGGMRDPASAMHAPPLPISEESTDDEITAGALPASKSPSKKSGASLSHRAPRRKSEDRLLLVRNQSGDDESSDDGSDAVAFSTPAHRVTLKHASDVSEASDMERRHRGSHTVLSSLVAAKRNARNSERSANPVQRCSACRCDLATQFSADDCTRPARRTQKDSSASTLPPRPSSAQGIVSGTGRSSFRAPPSARLVHTPAHHRFRAGSEPVRVVIQERCTTQVHRGVQTRCTIFKGGFFGSRTKRKRPDKPRGHESHFSSDSAESFLAAVSGTGADFGAALELPSFGQFCRASSDGGFGVVAAVTDFNSKSTGSKPPLTIEGPDGGRRFSLGNEASNGLSLQLPPSLATSECASKAGMPFSNSFAGHTLLADRRITQLQMRSGGVVDSQPVSITIDSDVPTKLDSTTGFFKAEQAKLLTDRASRARVSDSARMGNISLVRRSFSHGRTSSSKLSLSSFIVNQNRVGARAVSQQHTPVGATASRHSSTVAPHVHPDKPSTASSGESSNKSSNFLLREVGATGDMLMLRGSSYFRRRSESVNDDFALSQSGAKMCKKCLRKALMSTKSPRSISRRGSFDNLAISGSDAGAGRTVESALLRPRRASTVSMVSSSGNDRRGLILRQRSDLADRAAFSHRMPMLTTGLKSDDDHEHQYASKVTSRSSSVTQELVGRHDFMTQKQRDACDAWAEGTVKARLNNLDERASPVDRLTFPEKRSLYNASPSIASDEHRSALLVSGHGLSSLAMPDRIGQLSGRLTPASVDSTPRVVLSPRLGVVAETSPLLEEPDLVEGVLKADEMGEPETSRSAPRATQRSKVMGKRSQSNDSRILGEAFIKPPTATSAELPDLIMSTVHNTKPTDSGSHSSSRTGSRFSLQHMFFDSLTGSRLARRLSDSFRSSSAKRFTHRHEQEGGHRLGGTVRLVRDKSTTAWDSCDKAVRDSNHMCVDAICYRTFTWYRAPARRKKSMSDTSIVGKCQTAVALLPLEEIKSSLSPAISSLSASATTDKIDTTAPDQQKNSCSCCVVM